jgi:hypothetical protein
MCCSWQLATEAQSMTKLQNIHLARVCFFVPDDRKNPSHEFAMAVARCNSHALHRE